MFIEAIEESGAEGDLAGWYAQQRKSWGFLPNYAPAFGSRPGVGLAWTSLNQAIREGMDRRRYELVTIAAARTRSSTYCVAAHSKFLRDLCDDEATMLALAEDASAGALDEVDRALVHFATRIAADPASTTAADVEVLRDHGLSDADVADVVLAVAARCFFATVLDGLGAEPDEQLAAMFTPEVRDGLTVGRSFADAT